tara:strand:+ start:2694 stop:2951 length:258 start_codon:yes stop_codon:yes gene_type:complete
MNLKVLILDKVILLTQIEEVSADLGEPDCKLIEPFVINPDGSGTLSPWLVDLTTQNTFMIHSDKILTIADPNGKLIDKYEALVKV